MSSKPEGTLLSPRSGRLNLASIFSDRGIADELEFNSPLSGDRTTRMTATITADQLTWRKNNAYLI
jgi:hypothetical protein